MGNAEWTTELRCRYAETLRHFLAGRVTTDEYEDAYFDLEAQHGRDGAAWAVFACVWHLYDGITPHRMTGKYKLDDQTRRHVARWIVFLRSGAELAEVERRRASRVVRRVLVVVFLGSWVGSLMGSVVGMMLMAGMILVVLVRMCTKRAGFSLEPEHAERAFRGYPDDPWPFRSREELAKAVTRPTYLHG